MATATGGGDSELAKVKAEMELKIADMQAAIGTNIKSINELVENHNRFMDHVMHRMDDMDERTVMSLHRTKEMYERTEMIRRGVATIRTDVDRYLDEHGGRGGRDGRGRDSGDRQ